MSSIPFPFIENAVKHGVQSTNENSIIDITVTVKNAKLKLVVNNSTPSNKIVFKRKGLGLNNVKRRLNLLYPNSHAITINDKANSFHVNLSIDLLVSTHKKYKMIKIGIVDDEVLPRKVLEDYCSKINNFELVISKGNPLEFVNFMQ